MIQSADCRDKESFHAAADDAIWVYLGDKHLGPQPPVYTLYLPTSSDLLYATLRYAPPPHGQDQHKEWNLD